MKKIKIIFLSLFLFSCQQSVILDEAVVNYDTLPKVSINSEKKIIKNFYDSKFDEPFIDHALDNPPISFLNEWFENNLVIFGSENTFKIDVIDASLKKFEVQNNSLKKYEEKTVFLYEVNFLVEFILYDDSNFILANTIVESNRTTTSGKYISLHESSKIIDTLIIDCLIDFSKKAEELLILHMSKYIL